jgi:hypothetical protein
MGSGEQAQQDLAAALEALDARAARFVERRAQTRAERLTSENPKGGRRQA